MRNSFQETRKQHAYWLRKERGIEDFAENSAWRSLVEPLGVPLDADFSRIAQRDEDEIGGG
jgi:hypothetical protein